MDRISALRNIEDALRAFEEGETDLAATERRVAAVLRTYATDFEGEADVFRAVGEPPADGTVVIAPSKPAARERVRRAIGSGTDDGIGTNDGSDGGSEGDADGESGKERSPAFEVERV